MGHALFQPPGIAATAAHTDTQPGQGVLQGDTVTLGATLTDAVLDGCVAEAVAVCVAVGACETATTDTGGASAGAGMPAVATTGAIVAIARRRLAGHPACAQGARARTRTKPTGVSAGVGAGDGVTQWAKYAVALTPAADVAAGSADAASDGTFPVLPVADAVRALQRLVRSDARRVEDGRRRRRRLEANAQADGSCEAGEQGEGDAPAPPAFRRAAEAAALRLLLAAAGLARSHREDDAVRPT